jgi:hypothetical protein
MRDLNIIKPVNQRFSSKYDVRYMVDEFKDRNQIFDNNELNQSSKRELRSYNKSIYNSPRFNIIKDELLTQMENRYCPCLNRLNSHKKENNVDKKTKNLDMLDISYDNIMPISKILSNLSIFKKAYSYNKLAQEYYSNASPSKNDSFKESKEKIEKEVKQKRKSNIISVKSKVNTYLKYIKFNQ